VDPWRRGKTRWNVLDKCGESVLETMGNHGDKGIIDHWGTWYKHPSIGDYNKALLEDQDRKSTMDDKEHLLRESPRRKHLRDLVHESMTIQGCAMKKRAHPKSTYAEFALGTIVQVLLHYVHTTKADGKNLTLAVVEVVKKTIVPQCII
jgi:hypothetical protein